MKFTVNTKPLIEALDLGVINSNVSPFHKKSTIIQVSADKNELRLNVEAESIKSELVLKGSGEDDSAKIFVGSLLMKQLVGTFENPVTTLEFAEGGLILHSGTAKFTLPKLVDESDIELDRPTTDTLNADEITLDKSNWKFVQDRQMYAKSMSFIHPIYTYVWVGSEGDILVGDFDNSLFTHSVKNNLGTTCLLSDTIVNLFESLPEGAKIVKEGKDYIIIYKSDSLSYISQFSPKYEDEEDIGSYNSSIFLNMMKHSDQFASFDNSILNKYLNQAEMLSSSTDDTIEVSLENNILRLKDNNVDCKLAVKGDTQISDFTVEFKTDMLKRVVSNYPEEDICFTPIEQDDEVAGILIWDKDVTTVIAGVD